MLEIEKIHKVLIFVEKNFNRNISVEELEAISNYSYRNIQRIFKKIFKENIGEFQKRVRLEKGFKRLIYSTESISDISIDIGYESNQAFSKAFKNKFKITPNEARQNKENIFNNFIEEKRHSKIDSKTIYLDKIEVQYKLLVTNDYDNEIIDNLWDIIYDQNKNNTKISYFGVIIDQPLISIPNKSRYEACFSTGNEKIENYNSKFIFGGKYMKYTHFGSYDTILETYRLLYFDWLFNQQYEINAMPIIEHYEFGSINTTNEEDYITHILVPVK